MPPSPHTRSLLEAVDEPSLIVEAGRIAAANDAARDLLGRRIEGSDVRLVIRHPHALEHILSATAGDTEISGIGGAERPWTVAVRPLGGGALLVRLVDRSAARAAEKMRVDFVANASHELRTPLATIIGYAETLAENGDLDPEVHVRFGGIIRSEATRMLRIVEDLMSLSRIEADRFVPPAELVSVGDIARIAADNARRSAEERGVTLRLDIAPELPQLRGDFAQLLQVLDNLIGNAIRYGCGGSACTVRVGAKSRAGTVELSVSDDGEGIGREHLPRLTERFYRVDAARSRDSGGTGLGLAIVKHIVERHRGTLDIASAAGRGTTVTVRLPLS